MSLHRATRSGCRALENAVAASAMKRLPQSLGVLRQLAVPHLIAFQGNAADGCGVRSGLHKAGWFDERPHIDVKKPPILRKEAKFWRHLCLRVKY